MGELWFVGLGLGDERGLSQHALEALRGCARIFAEEYTATAPPGTLGRIAGLVGREVTRLDRPLLESERPVVEAVASNGRVALLVVGDPFAATTHVALRLAVERAGHTWHYVPNASILTAAAGFLGLMHYRFGRTVSLPLPAPGFEPRSPVDRIRQNRTAGLHSLVLLDLRPEEGRFLTASAAIRLLRERDEDATVLTPQTAVAVAARVGREDAAGWFGPVEAMERLDFGAPMHVLVVPADLHFEESEALERYRIGGSSR
jgi:diphthine synthase